MTKKALYTAISLLAVFSMLIAGCAPATQAAPTVNQGAAATATQAPAAAATATQAPAAAQAPTATTSSSGSVSGEPIHIKAFIQ